jgi:putative transposase
MPTFRRAFIEGGSYFFTVVTFGRLPILTTQESREILHAAWLDVQGRFPFRTTAVCLLPEHVHCIWSLPEGDAGYPVRWKEIKRLFTKSYLARVGPGETCNASRIMKGEAAIWQRRYWEHVIRDEQDWGGMVGKELEGISGGE